MGLSDLRRAQRVLSDFDAVGRVEELGTFLAYIHGLLGGDTSKAAAPGGSSSRERVNDTPEQQKYALTDAERAWTVENTALDAQLYNSLCGGEQRCPLRQLARATDGQEQRAEQPFRLRCDALSPSSPSG